MLNIGIIGSGRVAERHATALTNAQLWSIGSRDMTNAQAFAQRHGAIATENAFTDLSAMLADPNLDAVIIATPDKLHKAHILLALQAEKAILVEKPLCTSIESGHKIFSAYQQAKVTVAVGYHLRWHSGLRKLAEKIHANEFGNIHNLKLHWAVDFKEHGKWRIDSNHSQWFCLTVLGTHLVDIARWLMIPGCGEVIEIKSTVKNLPNSRFDSEANITLYFASGAIAEIFCSILFSSPFSLEIKTDQKNILGADLMGEIKNRKIVVDDEPLIVDATPNLYVAQLNNFSESIVENKQPEVSLDEGLKNVEILTTIHQSEITPS